MTIVDTGHQRPRELVLEVPDSPLEAVMSAEVWQQVYDRLARLTEAHRTTLVFVNTRRMAERVARQLSDRLGEQAVTAHHGSMAKEQRLSAEQRLKRGELKALVATASLELGIDIGDVDLVCQLGSPRSIASFLQRVGRSGHAVGGTPKGHLFPLSRDDLVECAALLDSVRRGELDRLSIPQQPLDVLAQQIVAEVSAQDWPEEALYDRLRRAWPYRDLSRDDFDAVVRMLAEGFATSRGRRGTLVHHDAINHMLRGRRGARLTALTSGGTIPDNADYQVLLEPENQTIGTVNEDFAVESLAGDVFQLGNNAYRIMRVERGVVRVEDAHGQPPTIPFWLGEAPGRSDELSASVSRLRAGIVTRLRRDASGGSAQRWLTEEIGIAEAAAEQLLEYLTASFAALECLPTHDTIVLERFFDEAGRHAACDPLAVRQPDQPRLGPRAAQALLPQVQLRTAGGGDRGQHRAVADHHAQFRTGGGGAVSAFGQRAIAADPGAARCADVRHALAVGGGRRAGAAAVPRRQEGARRSSRAWRRRIWSPACSPTRWPAPRTWPAIARSPIIR